MSDSTKIEWAHATWNPWEGCTKVSPGCAHCYAEARNLRFAGGANWGKGAPRRRTAKANWSKPLRWNTEVEAHPDYRHRVFPSLCDWLDAEVPIEWLADFMGLINKTPNLDWLLLTKRPENFQPRMRAAAEWVRANANIGDLQWFIKLWSGELAGSPPPHNVWIGTSVEDQKRADERIPELLKIPARVRFLSVEPLLGPVDLGFDRNVPKGEHMLDWIICGGESGPKARPCNIEWIRSIVEQCKSASVPCFVKQLGGNLSDADLDDCSKSSGKSMAHKKGGDPAEWPSDLRVREFPEVRV